MKKQNITLLLNFTKTQKFAHMLIKRTLNK